MRIVNTRVGVTFKAVVAAALGLAALSGNARPAVAQITSKPIVSSIQTSLGTKNGYPAMATYHNYTINGVNFSTETTHNTITVEKQYVVNGVPTWKFYMQAYPSLATSTQLKANIMGASEGTYRLSVYVYRTGQSNWKTFLVVPPTVTLGTVTPAAPIVGTEVTLKGNLFPMTSTHVVLLPPAEFAPYLGQRWVIPTSKTPFEIKFTVPADLWGGSWKVYVNGSPGINTNQKSINIQSTTPVYSVSFRSFTCLDLSADGPGTDEIFLPLLTYIPGGYSVASGCEPKGTKVWENVDTNTQITDPIDMSTYWTEQGSYRIQDPSKPYFIIGMGEADQYSWSDFGFYWYWDHQVHPMNYALNMAQEVRASAYHHEHVGDVPVLLSKDYPKIAAWLKNNLATWLTLWGDECLGTAIVKFTKDEVYQARKLNGQPLTKILDFTGDSSHYKVEVQLKKIN